MMFTLLDFVRADVIMNRESNIHIYLRHLNN